MISLKIMEWGTWKMLFFSVKINQQKYYNYHAKTTLFKKTLVKMAHPRKWNKIFYKTDNLGACVWTRDYQNIVKGYSVF